MASQTVIDAVTTMASPAPDYTEASLQADVVSVLRWGGLDLGESEVVRSEHPVADGTRRRIDVKVGHLVVEVKKDLSRRAVLEEATGQLAGYVETLARMDGQTYAGVLTDGRRWHLFALTAGGLEQVSSLTVSGPQDCDRLLAWLDTIMATRSRITPTPTEIAARLGATSPAHQLDYRALLDLYERGKGQNEVKVARELWARLLRTAFGEAFEDDERLFVNHTLLVLTAEIIAHAVVGFDLRGVVADAGTQAHSGRLTPGSLVRGWSFADAQIGGVVEADFFDWVLDVPGGQELVAALAFRVAQFDWSGVEHDALKVLYESVIDASVREALGEYYTPDWLADLIGRTATTRPLEDRVLDPACGSGTFVFHAVRRYVEAARAADVPDHEIPRRASEHVLGIDVHPVAVAFARVTYLLALGTDLVAGEHDPFTVPIYLGDSMQWDHQEDLFAHADGITIRTYAKDLTDTAQDTLDIDLPGLARADGLVPLRFPSSVLADAAVFDNLVRRWTGLIEEARRRGARPSVDTAIQMVGGLHGDEAQLRETFTALARLDSPVWSYYIRNLVRPVWLSRPENRVDVLIGNPPWLAYSKMTASMQARYKALAKDRNLLAGRRGASGRDLSTLFLVRSVELYLKEGGEFAMVMPQGVLTRAPHAGLRTGRWDVEDRVHLRAKLRPPWDLDKVTTGFPMSSCVVLGSLVRHTATPMPSEVVSFSGRLKDSDSTWEQAESKIRRSLGAVRAVGTDAEISPYAKRFRQGAILVPRRLIRVDRVEQAGPLGKVRGRTAVVSHVSRQDKPPYDKIEPMRGSVETRFLYPMLLGESLAAFRVVSPALCVLPIDRDRIMTLDQAAVPEGLGDWWGRVEEHWRENRKPSERKPLVERMDFHGQLSSQLPLAPHRVVYMKSGSRLNAAYVSDTSALIDHKLYWSVVSGPAEAAYLTAVLNSRSVIERTEPLQARGLFGPRDIDKYVWRVLIPSFDPQDPLHVELSGLGTRATALAEGVDADGKRIEAVRLSVEQEISDALGDAIEDAVVALLDD